MAIDCEEGWGWCGVAAESGRVVASTIGQSSANAASNALEAKMNGLRSLDVDLSRTWLEELRQRLVGAARDDPELDLIGTEFQNNIWKTCSNVPPGETRTYGWIARSAGYPERGYARAVGAALGANPALIFVPCHRVVTARGDTGGYALGRDLKRKLLNMERIQAATI